jgi:hypothetical protein
MGTGASGEILATDPHKYESSITSPMTITFIPEKEGRVVELFFAIFQK